MDAPALLCCQSISRGKMRPLLIIEMMRDVYTSTFQSLLDEVEAQDFNELRTAVLNAISTYSSFNEDLQLLVDYRIQLLHKLGEITEDANEIIDSERFSLIERYRLIQELGGDIHFINRAAIEDGVIPSLRFRVLKKLFKLSDEEIRHVVNES